ncbi:tRNA (uracil-5-)-methyltransferase homolog A-like [Mizuhopecten yessoensis]|uniref:tRNA (uracil(54)-C(5))-methyltransferase n=1 Tax=Mizuhopecten yessoensis TaxID=6573 RepID=A0A210Q6C0_MIZYE|nr:tRNA (uracil-5-)-methyltransferase homolog A-like [Mizuhopecten yessoensis]OWF44278.1 tRNA (uracil-5-)-methyltransferase-like A [Mizuhopecten yessoensis]
MECDSTATAFEPTVGPDRTGNITEDQQVSSTAGKQGEIGEHVRESVGADSDNCGTSVNRDEVGMSEDVGNKDEAGRSEDVGDEKDEEDEEESTDQDPSSTTKTVLFTSEIFKIEILNLPRFGFKQLKKRLASLDVKPVKIKAIERKGFAFATFRSEEEREDATRKITGHVWKERKLKVKKAPATMDPLVQKRKRDSEQKIDEPPNKKDKMEDDLPPEIRLKNAVSPLWKVPYEEQLKTKMQDMVQILKTLANRIQRENPEFRGWLHKQRSKYDGKCCEMLPIKPSPVLEDYRNKCEFTVGKDINGQDNTVGFRYGLYKQGSKSVGEPQDQVILPDSMKKFVKSFQKFIRASGYGAYDPQSHEGHWRILTTRTCRGSDDFMAVVDFDPQHLPKEELECIKTKLKDYFTTGEGRDCGVTSLFFHTYNDRPANPPDYELLMGEKFIQEEMLDMKFRISPGAFFQVNTAAAEVLYTQIADWCNVSPDTTVLDICCGTGTIGLSVAKKVSRVIGIEMCQEAIDDAKQNAKINDIENVHFVCSKAEDAIKRTMKSLRSTDVVAVVDPPRPGLQSSVFQALRRSPHLTKVVFVSCNPKAAMNNFIDLTRQTSRRNKGPPYRPVKAVPIDMFPQTPHCELVIMFERDQPYTNQEDSPGSP